MLGVGEIPRRRTASHRAESPERYDCPRSATSRAKSPAARTRQHVTVSGVVPAHQVGLDGVLTERRRHRIVDVSGRDVPVRLHALQSLNQSLFECVAHHVFQLDTVGSLCKLGGRQPSADGRGPRGAWLDDPPHQLHPLSRLYGRARAGCDGRTQARSRAKRLRSASEQWSRAPS